MDEDEDFVTIKKSGASSGGVCYNSTPKEGEGRMKKAYKGEIGYFRHERFRRSILSLILLAVPVIILVSGFLYFGNQKNLMTIIGLVAFIPFAMQLTTTVAVFLHKSLPEEEAEAIKAHAGDLFMAYELFVTNEKGSTMVDAFAICGNSVVGLVTEKKGDPAVTKTHIEKTLRANGHKVTVQFYKELSPFLKRLDDMNLRAEELRAGAGAFKPDERYPDYTREEVIWHLLLRLSL